MLKYFTRNIRYLLSLLFLIVPLYGQETLSDEEIKGISDNIQKIQKEKEVLVKMVSEYEKSAKTDSFFVSPNEAKFVDSTSHLPTHMKKNK